MANQSSFPVFRIRRGSPIFSTIRKLTGPQSATLKGQYDTLTQILLSSYTHCSITQRRQTIHCDEPNTRYSLSSCTQPTHTASDTQSQARLLYNRSPHKGPLVYTEKVNIHANAGKRKAYSTTARIIAEPTKSVESTHRAPPSSESPLDDSLRAKRAQRQVEQSAGRAHFQHW